MNYITRFAPSPTGHLHLGNVRTALINWLFTKKHGGKFILRIDDTDTSRSKEEFTNQIYSDLKWLGIQWDETFHQVSGIDRYTEIFKRFVDENVLYPCFESAEEIDFKRKLQLGRNLPPIYDRASLKLTKAQIEDLIAQGKKPHYRFKINHEKISWNDMIRGEVVFDGDKISDPILIREDGSFTYMLASAIDDADYNISHVIRGEDHITNTAINIQITKALRANIPTYGHLSLLKTKDHEMSKRLGGFDILSLRDRSFFPMSINSLLATLGTSQNIEIYKDLNLLVENFDIKKFGKAQANYDENELVRLNHKLIQQTYFAEVKDQLNKNINEDLWEGLKQNINLLPEINDLYGICFDKIIPIINEEDKTFLESSIEYLPPDPWDINSFSIWTKKLLEKFDRKGKELFMPIRKAITGRENGPEMKYLMALTTKEKIINRLKGIQS